MKRILKIILISILLSPTIAQAESDNPLLDFDVIHNASIEEIQSLIDQGYDINEIKENKTPTFHRIVYRKRKDIILFLIEAGADVNIREPHNGDSVLHEAAYGNQPEIIQLLIDAGADIEAKNKYYARPLHYAAIYQNLDAARKLLELGADVNAVAEDDGTTVFMSTVRSTSKPNNSHYDDSNIDANLSLGKRRKKRLAMLKLLIEYGADPHAVDNEGNNARTYIYPKGGWNANIVAEYLFKLGVK